MEPHKCKQDLRQDDPRSEENPEQAVAAAQSPDDSRNARRTNEKHHAQGGSEWNDDGQYKIEAEI